MPRYVVLRHELPSDSARASHWDLMFEFQGVLRTWSVESEPAIGRTAIAQLLADHRLEYLEYQGPVSGGRGTVTRWDEGEYTLEESSDRHWQALIYGRRLRSRVKLERDKHDHSWRVSFEAAPTSG
jgi:hypothetical protein